MNVLNKAALQSLKKNGIRTLATIIGVILSSSMICGATSLASSGWALLCKTVEYNAGSWDVSVSSADSELLSSLSAAPDVKNAAWAQKLGYAEAEGSVNDYMPYIYLLGAGDNFEKIMPIHIISGSYPKSDSEILLPEHLNYNGGVSHKTGEKISLGLGKRISRGRSLGQKDILSYNGEEKSEELLVERTKTYEVVGFYERPQFEDFSSPGYTAVTLAENSQAYDYEIYLDLLEPKKASDFAAAHGVDPSEIVFNEDSMYYGGALPAVKAALISLSAIIITLILLGSVALVYNAFAISISERTKQFGIFASIGASRRQLLGSVLFEARVISAVGIPAGIAAGTAGIAVTLSFIGDDLALLFGSESFSPQNVAELSVSPAGILASFLIAFATVLISAWVPAKRAARVSAIEAIRQSRDIKTTDKPVKISGLVRRLFGFPAELAVKYHKRNRKKYRITVLSLFMSVVLFISASSFSYHLTRAANFGADVRGYDLSLSAVFKEEAGGSAVPPSPAIVKKLGEARGVSKFGYSSRLSVWGFDPESLKSPGENALDESTLFLLFVPDGDFDALLAKRGLKREDYYDAEKPLALALEACDKSFDKERGKLTVSEASGDGERKFVYVRPDARVKDRIFSGLKLDENGKLWAKYIEDSEIGAQKPCIYLPIEDAAFTAELRSGGTVREAPFFLSARALSQKSYAYPESMFSAVADVLKIDRDPELTYDFNFLSDDWKSSYADIRSVALSEGFSSYNISNAAYDDAVGKGLVKVVTVLCYGFVILISLIAAANAFNTISTNISLRRREFATLKSVGATKRDIKKIMGFECLLYCSRALLYSLPVSLIISVLIYASVRRAVEYSFSIPWSSVIIAASGIFAVVAASTVYSAKKLKKENIIDSLKNENI